MKKIHRAAVLGAGVMGSGIAALLAGAGLKVTLLDVVPKELTAAEEAKGITLDAPAFRNRFAQAGLDRIVNPRSGMLFEKGLAAAITIGNMTDDMGKLADCDWIIEVVVERLDVKRSVMEQIAACRKPGSIVSTNTSGVSIQAIAEGMPEEFRQHFLGTHFFNPPRHMRLFEMIPTCDTLPEVVERMAGFAERELGKSVVYAKDTPNFIGNRIGVYAAINCMQLMEEYGYNIPTVDLLTGPVLGRPRSATFKTADLVGLDILSNVAKNVLENTSDPKEQTLYALPQYVNALVTAGALGDKTKCGFYKKDIVNGKKTTLAYDLETKTYLPLTAEEFPSVVAALKSANPVEAMAYGEGKESKFVWETLKLTILYAARLVPEISDDFTMIDKALVAGFNWVMGPFQLWDALGFQRAAQRMKTEGEPLPTWVEEKLAAGATALYQSGGVVTPYISLTNGSCAEIRANSAAALRDLGDEVLCLEFHSKGNAISDATMDIMEEAAALLQAGDWRGLVIGNEGKQFSAGANLMLIGAMAKDQKWTELEQMISRLQQAMLGFKYASCPVVAAPFGTTLGGGAEVAMHTACCTPHAETYMGLVEAGVGLLPSGGGCAELLVRANDRCGDNSKMALLPALKRVWKLIATSTVSSSAHDATAKGFFTKGTHVILNRDGLLDAAQKAVLELDSWNYHPPVAPMVTVLGDYGRAAITYDLEMMKSGGFVSEYDAFVANKIAHVLTGGNLPAGVQVTEQYLLDLERESFLSLCGEEKTQQRIAHMLATGKPLRN